MIKKMLPAAFALLALALPAYAQTSTGKVTTAAPVYTNNTAAPLSLDTNGNLRVAGGGGGGGVASDIIATGGVVLPADDTPTAGVTIPLPVGGNYSAPLPSYTNGDRGTLQLTSGGGLVTAVGGTQFNGADGAPNNGLIFPVSATSGGQTFQQRTGFVVAPIIFNGATWDREFTCSNSASISVAAGTTTQLVALVASQAIRVCSVVLTGDTGATTTQFVYGTGVACATGLTPLTGAMRIQDEGNISLSAANGSLFRGAASNALCIVTTTGAVTGFISYAQF